MTKTFTENDLVRFLYGELNENEKAEIKQALVTDGDLQHKYNNLKSVTKDLDRLTLSPSRRSIDNILKFSREYQKESV